MEESKELFEVVAETTAGIEQHWALVVDAFDQRDGLRNIYVGFGPFLAEELDEREKALREYGEEIQEFGPLTWEDGETPAVDPGITRMQLLSTIPVIER